MLERLGRDRYESVLGEHSGIVRAAVASAHGQIVDTQGDSFFAVFRTAQEACTAAVAAQREFEAHGWPGGEALKVRMGLHSAEPKTSGERYVGMGVHRAARIGSAAHGGQILLSEATRALLADDRPDGVALRDLGAYRLKDLNEPVRLYQLVPDGLRSDFPRPRSLDSGRQRLLRRRSVRFGLVATLALVVAGAVVGVVASGGSSKPARLVANSIAVIDPKSGKPVGDVPLGFSPTDVDAGGDKVWVLNGSAHTATAIDPSTLRVVQTLGVDGPPDSQYAVHGSEWVGFPGGVDEIDNNGVTGITLWKPYATRCFVFVTGDGRNIWVSEGQHVAVLSAANGSVLRKQELPADTGIPPGTTCYGLRYSGGRLLAIRNTDYSIGPVDLSSGSYTPVATDYGLTSETFSSANWAAGFGSYWIGSWKTVNTNTNQTVTVMKRLEPVGGQVMSQTVNAGGPIAVDPASGVWGFGGKHQTARLVHVDPKSGLITRTIPLRHTSCCPNAAVGNGIGVGHGRLWVALDSP